MFKKKAVPLKGGAVLKVVPLFLRWYYFGGTPVRYRFQPFFQARWLLFGKWYYFFFSIGAYLLHVENGTTLQSGTNMVPLLEVDLKRLLLSKRSHIQPFFGRKWYHFAKWY